MRWHYAAAFLLLFLLAGCSQTTTETATTSIAPTSVAPPNSQVSPPPTDASEKLSAPSVPAAARRTSLADRPNPQPSPASAPKTAAAPVDAGPSIGTIVGYRANQIALYASEYSDQHTRAETSSLPKSLNVLARSPANLRLKVRTPSGDYWVAPTDVEFTGPLSQGTPAIRTRKHSAGGRGID